MIKRILRSLICCVGLLTLAASAHEPFEITANARVFSDRITINVLITDSTAALLCLPDITPASRLHAKEFSAEHSRVEKCAAELYVVKDGDKILLPRSVQMHLTFEEDLDVTLTYPAPTSEKLSFEAVHLKRLADPIYGATFTATSEHAFLAQKLLRADDPLLEVSLNAEKSASAGLNRSSFLDFLRLGVEHILTGYDHLLFLAGLLIVCTRLRTTLIIITAFTLAHSITLALAGLDIVTLPSRIVEPCIAATIVFVGIENLWRGRGGAEPKGRWILTFAFGLMHGFGFASALQEAGLPHGGFEFVVPLLGFNLGVEVGQISAAAIFLPILFLLRKRSWFARYGVPSVSLLVSGAGLYWLIQRTMF